MCAHKPLPLLYNYLSCLCGHTLPWKQNPKHIYEDTRGKYNRPAIRSWMRKAFTSTTCRVLSII